MKLTSLSVKFWVVMHHVVCLSVGELEAVFQFSVMIRKTSNSTDL